jgi:branched-chain amino acid transport system ATP-binding protein
MSAPALRAIGLSAFYGRAQALFDVDLQVESGQVVALIGRNGAGKSTTLKALIGLAAARGAIEFDGRAIGALPAYCRARMGLGYVPEERRVFTDLTVRENLALGAGRRDFDLAPLMQLFAPLRDLLDRRATHLSGGEQQMLAVARTLAARPRVVLLDEPSEGMAPLVTAALADAIVALQGQGKAVLLSEQNLQFVARVADRALLLEHGHVVGSAAPAELLPPSRAVRSVLGL